MAKPIVVARVIVGWRTRQIENFLDLAVSTEGFVEYDLSEEKKPDGLGRLTRRYADRSELYRVYYSRHKEEIKKRDADKYLRLKDQHSKYCELYLLRYPGSTPCSVNQFQKLASKLWKAGQLEEALAVTYGIGDQMKNLQAQGWETIREFMKRK